MENTHNTDELINQIKELVKKLDKPNKNLIGWFTLFSSFLASVVIAGLSLYFSNLQSERNYRYNLRQVEIQKANLRVAELKALNDLIPSIASNDSNIRNVAFRLLEAANKKGNAVPADGTEPDDSQEGIVTGTAAVATETSLIDEFYVLVKIAESSTETVEKRTDALIKIEKVITAENAPEDIREKGLNVVTGIAAAPSTPAAIRRTAGEIIANIKNVSLDELPQVLNKEKVSRSVSSIILHHVGTPFSTANYKGLKTIMAFANFQINNKGWREVSWHFAIAPDGSIWLGAPLNEAAIHTIGQNKTSISILLFMDGDKELPTGEQTATLTGLLPLLLTHLGLEKKDVHPHRFYGRGKSCPGGLVSDEYIAKLAGE